MRLFSFKRRRSTDDLLDRIKGVVDGMGSLEEQVSGVRATLDGILTKACSDVDVARVVEAAVASRMPERGVLEERLSGLEGSTRDVSREIDAARMETRQTLDEIVEEGRTWVGRQLDDKLANLREAVDRQGGRVVESVTTAARRAEEAASGSVREVREDLARLRESTAQELDALRNVLTEAQEEFARFRARLRAELEASAALLREGIRQARDPGAGRGFLARILARLAPAPRVDRIAEGLAVIETAIAAFRADPFPEASGEEASARAWGEALRGFEDPALRGLGDAAGDGSGADPEDGETGRDTCVVCDGADPPFDRAAGPSGRDAHLLRAGDPPDEDPSSDPRLSR
ncbi:MAG: hypothetical protein JXP34_04805 [Planctomycetes bacterium]|nr:hypothetical protein [Planctomycetota bacterium]